MVHTKYKLTPQDAAACLFIENFSHKRECEILLDLFRHHNEMIVWDYRHDYLLFKRSVMNLLNLYELDDRTYNEAELILREVDGSIENDADADCFGAYFKLIWLQLMYSGISYRKIKLRTLLHDFGYKRRTQALTSSMICALNALGLVTYLRNYEVCDIRDVKLDDMVMIRLS